MTVPGEAQQRAERLLASVHFDHETNALAEDVLELLAENERLHEVVRAERRTLTEKVLELAGLVERVEAAERERDDLREALTSLGPAVSDSDMARVAAGARVAELEEALRRIRSEAKTQAEMAASDGFEDGYRSGWMFAGEWADEALADVPVAEEKRAQGNQTS